MTYCAGILVHDGLVMIADTRTNAGVDDVSVFRKLHIFETPGERVFAIGTPNQMERTLSDGLVSGIRREPLRNLVQTSAPVSPGSSGGGLFDERGNLIGITTLGSFGRMQNLNFAIAASDFWK